MGGFAQNFYGQCKDNVLRWTMEILGTYKNEILKGIEEVEKGELVDYEELMKKHRK